MRVIYQAEWRQSGAAEDYELSLIPVASPPPAHPLRLLIAQATYTARMTSDRLGSTGAPDYWPQAAFSLVNKFTFILK
jgi:hypothetical protein